MRDGALVFQPSLYSSLLLLLGHQPKCYSAGKACHRYVLAGATLVLENFSYPEVSAFLNRREVFGCLYPQSQEWDPPVPETSQYTYVHFQLPTREVFYCLHPQCWEWHLPILKGFAQYSRTHFQLPKRGVRPSIPGVLGVTSSRARSSPTMRPPPFLAARKRGVGSSLSVVLGLTSSRFRSITTTSPYHCQTTRKRGV